MPTLDVRIVSDVICPWCYVGHRRLAKARALLAGTLDLRTTWHPFQLNPAMPRDGIDRRAYRTAKFGSWERSQELDARLVAVGRDDGIAFHFDRIARTPNTLDAHRLIALARTFDRQDDVAQGLFTAYFTDGVDIGRRENLVALATTAGLPAADVDRTLTSDESTAEVLADERRYKALGIQGVPAFVVGQTVAVAGAAQPETMAQTFRQLAAL